MIFVVEDDQLLLQVLLNGLTLRGYETMSCGNGLDAVQQYRSHQNRIKLMVIDIILPGITGLQAYEMIRDIDDAVDALFITGMGIDPATSKRIKQMNCVCLEKPFRISDLCFAIEALSATTKNARPA